MKLLDIFRRHRPKSTTADEAKQRLQMLMKLDRGPGRIPDFLPLMQRELIDVISKYVEIDERRVTIEFDRNETTSMLEVNVELPHVGVPRPI